MPGKKVPRWLLIGLTAVVLAVVVISVRVYTAHEREMRQEAERNLAAIAQLKRDQVVWWLEERLSDGAVLLESPQFAATVASWLATPDATEEARLRQRLEGMQLHYDYSGAVVTDAQGQIRLISGDAPDELHPDVAARLSQALASGRPLLTDLHRMGADGDPHIDLVVPLTVPDGGPAPVGAVILQIDPGDFLYPLIQSWPTPSESGETLLVRREGDGVLFLNDLRFMEGAALRYGEPVTRTELPAVQAALGARGVVYGRDYRGAEVMAVVEPIAGSEWYIVSKVDMDEVLAGWRTRSRLGMALAVVGVLALLATGVAVWRAQTATQYEALLQAQAARQESEGRYRTTLMSVGDGVIATDGDGRVRMMNPVAEELTGWTEAEAVGRPLAEVFPIINEETRAEVENPVARVLREGHVVGLANHTVLIAKEGTEWPIADSAAPIRDAAGATSGVVLVFRDQTAERAAQRAIQQSEERYRLLAENSVSAIATHEMVYDEAGQPVDYIFRSVNPAFEKQTGLRAADILGRRVTEVIPGIQETTFIQRYGRVAETGQSIVFEEASEPLGRHYHIGAYKLGEGRFATVFQDITERVQAEAALQRERDNLAAVMAALPVQLLMVDQGECVAGANPAAERYFGVTPSTDSPRCGDLIGCVHRHEDPSGCGHAEPCDDCLLYGAIRAVLAGGPSVHDRDMEALLDTAQGRERRWLRFSIEPVILEGERRALVALHDITDRVRAEEALAQERILLRTVLDHLPDAVYAKDLQGRKTLSNAADLAYMGLSSEEEVLGKTDAEVYGDHHARGFEEADRRVIEEGLPIINQEGWTRTPDGRDRCFLGSKVPLHDQNGQVVGLVGITRDITERKRWEEALRESEGRFRELVHGAPDAIYVQTDGCYAYVNPAAVALLGAESAEELLGTPVLQRISVVHQEAARERMRRVNEDREHLPVMGQVWLRLDGTPLEVEVAAAPTVYEGRPGAITFARDISDRKAMEAQLRQAQKMEAVGRLAGGVAHDFNNMLQVILGNADMALDLIPPEEPLHEYLEEIHRAGKRSADLTRQLLAFARKQTISPRVLDPNDTISGMLRMLRRLVGEEISLVWMPGADVGAIKMDPAQMDQILADLVVNARDAIEGVGQVTIETANVEIDQRYADTHPGSPPGRYVRLMVTDDGCGMDRETLNQLFEPFFTTKPVGEGTGLGLATIYGIVRQNQGFINAYSEPAQGTIFRIYLPRYEQEIQPAEEATAHADLPRGDGTVLLVEDEASLRALAERILQRLGYAVLSAATPHEALELSAAHQGEIVLLVTDVVMPQMNGRDLATVLQTERPGLRCLYMSGYTANVVVHRGVVDEGTLFIQKPFTVEELAVKVRDAIEG